MSDYIKREDAIEKIKMDCNRFDHVPKRVVEFFVKGMESVPSADVVEVVRCKDCMYNDRGWCGSQEYGTRHVEDNDFCSQGEERRKK